MTPLRIIATTSPEKDLRQLFAEEDELTERIAEVREQQKQARKRYADAHNLLILPSMSKLREVLS